MIRDIGFVDLHCHFLPGIDDGAKDTNESEAAINQEIEDGCIGIAFSPHFYMNNESEEEFYERRERAYRLLNPSFAHKMWAEVRMHPELPECSLEKLSIGSYILLEFPYSKRPIWGDYVIKEVLKKDYIPILAHIERFPYLTEADLKKYKSDGCILQSNAELVIENPRLFKKLYKRGLIDILASDAHGYSRPPQLLEAYAITADLCGYESAKALIENSKQIFHTTK